MKNIISIILFIAISSSLLISQYKDEVKYIQIPNGNKTKSILSFDLSKIQKPKSPNDFKQFFHFPPKNQDTTGTCWCWSTSSFLETEIKRLRNIEVKLSVMFTVYYEYVEKCRRFIREKGNSLIDEGSEQNAVLERIKQYGIVRESDYTGLVNGKTTYNHKPILKEIRSYLNYIRENKYWDEEKALEYIKLILNKYIGEPPKEIVVDGKKMTPKEYQETVLKIPFDDYIDFMSTKLIPFYIKGEYGVPDNWWHNSNYYNIPLEEFYNAIKESVKNGYSVAMGGDESEPGLNADNDIGIIPTFDCPPENINQDSREFRFNNRTSTDDHGIHVIGYTKIGNWDWFLIKESYNWAYTSPFKGYIYYREDYIKLKMLSITVHKDAVKNLLTKFK